MRAKYVMLKSLGSWLAKTLKRIGAFFRRLGFIKGGAVVIVVFCGLLLLWNVVLMPALMGMMMASMPRPVIAVSTAETKKVSWTPGIEAVGTAGAFRGADLAAEADGTITAIDVAPQTHVSAGQRLVQIDDTVEQADLIAAKANIKMQDAAQARSIELRRKGVASQAALDDASNQLDAARSGLARIEAMIDLKTLTAPYDGTVGIPRVDVGQYVTKGTVLITLQDLDRLYVDFTVPEQAAVALSQNGKVRFGLTQDRLDYQGKIIGIDPKVDPKTRLVAVRAEIDDARGALKPGQFLRVRLDLPAEPNVLAVPETAVVPSLYGDYVYVVAPAEGGDKAKDNEAKDKDKPQLVARQVIVKIGRRDAKLVEIRDGLKSGDVVVTSGQNSVQNGAPVQINNTADPTKFAQESAR